MHRVVPTKDGVLALPVWRYLLDGPEHQAPRTHATEGIIAMVDDEQSGDVGFECLCHRLVMSVRET